MTQTTDPISPETAKLLHGVDASRRAGFAKYFSERAKNEELSHDVNVAREDVRLYESAFAFIWGFANGFQHLQTGSPVSKEVRDVLARFRGVVNTHHAMKGQTAARHILNLHAGGNSFDKVDVDRLIAREKQQGVRAGRRQVLQELVKDGLLTETQVSQFNASRKDYRGN